MSSIVLIVLDQLRHDALGCAGNPYVRTPNLDRLADTSVRFETCITNGPLCRPARTTLMTGLPVHLHRQSTNHGMRPPDAVPSHVRQLREAGFHTAVVGKTHLHDGTGHLDEHRALLAQWGFADAVELPDPQAHWLQSAHSDHLTATTPKHAIDKYQRWRSYIVHQSETQDLASPDDAPWQLAADDHLDAFCARAAVERIRALPDDDIYLQVSFPGPHPPFDPPREWLESFELNDPGLPAPVGLTRTGPMSPVAARHRARRRRTWTEADWRRLRRAYFAKVSWLDECVGRVLDALQQIGLDPWIVLTSDHGEMLVDHGVTGKVLPYESSIRVPLIVRPPGGVPGRVDVSAVDHLDLVATLIDVAGLAPGDHGTSLVGRVRDVATQVSHKDVVFEAMGYVALRTERATFAWDREHARPAELYDRVLDPEQAHNRVELDESLVAELVDRLRRMGAL